MKARVPFTYIQPYSPSGDRKSAVPALWVSSFEIDIPQVDPEDAPVVAQWTSSQLDSIGRPEVVTVSCRHHDGEFYVLASLLGDVEQKADEFAEEARKRRGTGGQFILLAQVLCAGQFELKRSTWPEDKRVLSITDAHFGPTEQEPRLVETQTRQFARRHADAMTDSRELDEAAARRNSRFISIDNILWRRVSEPKIGLRPPPDLPWFSAVYIELGDGVSLDLTGKRPSPLEWRFYRLDQLETVRMMAFLLGVAVDPGRTLQSAEMLKPELFVFQPKANLLYRALNLALEEYGPCLGGENSEVINLYVDLRETVDRLDVNSGIADMEKAVDTSLLPFMSCMPADKRSVKVNVSLMFTEDSNP